MCVCVHPLHQISDLLKQNQEDRRLFGASKPKVGQDQTKKRDMGKPLRAWTRKDAEKISKLGLELLKAFCPGSAVDLD